MTGFVLEVPRRQDAAAIADCAQASFLAAFSTVQYPPHDLAHFLDDAMGPARYAAQIDDPAYAFRIARDGDVIVGMVKGGPNVLPMPPGEPARDATFELHQLYLRESAHGTGLADAMMVFFEGEARARGAVSVVLSVYIDNVRAQRFYARHGYAEIGKNPFRVGDTIDDDRVWRKFL